MEVRGERDCLTVTILYSPAASAGEMNLPDDPTPRTRLREGEGYSERLITMH